MGATLPYIQTHDHLASTSQHLQSPELRQQLSISPSLFSAQRYINSLVSSICSYHLRFSVSRTSECTYITILATAVRLIPLPLRLTPSTPDASSLRSYTTSRLLRPPHFMASNVLSGDSLSKPSFPPPLPVSNVRPFDLLKVPIARHTPKKSDQRSLKDMAETEASVSFR